MRQAPPPPDEISSSASVPRSADGSTVLVHADGVWKSFGKVTALAGLDLEVRRGETLGLLGPNGAGKTTFMHLLAGVERPDRGRITIADGDPTHAAVRRNLGLAPQALALYPRLTAAENLRFFGRIHRLSGADLEQAVQRSLQLADLENRAGDRAGTFSGGMKRRLNLACAIIHQPQLLLLDEPTAGVDPQSRNHLFRSIERLKESGLTVLYSTHLMEEADQLCDRVAIVDHGKLLALGTTAELLHEHRREDLESLFLDLTGSEVRD